MARIYNVIFAIAIVCLLVPTQYAKAITYDEIVQEVNFSGISGADELQNSLDDGTASNYDSWDPVPQGSWFGGWSVENRLQLSDVPDTDCVVALATVCRFGTEIIMSGAARTLVRLPVYTSSDPWDWAKLNVYEISLDTEYTFSHENDTASTFGVQLGQMRVNFTAGTHRLVFWSAAYDPTDTSPTDGNDHFTRSNRTYVFVDAPIKPATAYLFITYVHYPSDKYIDIMIEPDSLDIEGLWNHSTIAVYNEEAPDTYSLDINDFNLSLGYSFDFRNGFGNSAYGLNVWMESGEDIEYLTYVNMSKVQDTDYLTLMVPFRSTTDNVTWDIIVQEYHPDDGSVTEFLSASNMLMRDFILFSIEDDWDTCSTAHGLLGTGWFRVVLSIDNSTRIYLSLWDEGPAKLDERTNKSWKGSYVGNIWDSNYSSSYNFAQKVRHDVAGAGYYDYHWSLMSTLQFNNYYWEKTTPPTTGTDKADPTENMTLTSRIFFGFGKILIKVGDAIWPLSPTIGGAFAEAGMAIQMISLANVLPDFIGDALDKIHQIGEWFKGIGQWIWRAAQEVVGFIRWFVETITYYASIILGIIVLMVALVILFLPMWFSAKLGQLIVNVLRGRYDVAVDDLGNLALTAKKIVPGRRGG